METIRKNLKSSWNYIIVFLKWIIISVTVGILGGILGSVFHIAIDVVTEFRHVHPMILLLLPVGGIFIAGMYHLFASKEKIDTNRVIESVRKNSRVPLVMIPLIFIGTVITHGLGGSAGREGAALQLGGGIGYNFGKLIRLKEKDMHIVVMAGMSSVFTALFGTPLTAAVFSLEVTNVGTLHYAGLLPCVIASVTAFHISQMFGIPPVRFLDIPVDSMTVLMLGKVMALAILCALVSILFCTALHKTEQYMSKWFKNRYLRAVVGGAAVVLLTAFVGSQEYNGAGSEIIARAMVGEARPEAFLLKIVFTAITIGAGFKGGEIVPAFFVGSTFGCIMGSLLGISPGFAAAIGFVALFCSVVNCPLASIILSVEVFGAEGILFFAVTCAVSFMLSGRYGLYHSQEIVYSKLDGEEVHVYTK